MALLDLEGFDSHNTVALLRRFRYASIINYFTGTDLYGGRYVQTTSSGSIVGTPSQADTAPTAATSRIIAGVFINLNAGDSGELFRVFGPNTTHCTIETGSTGEMQLYNGSISLIDSPTYTNPNIRMKRNVWHWVEFDITVNNTTGSATVWVDGMEAATWTNVDTQNGAIVDIIGVSYFTSSNHDSLFGATYLLDTTGSANNSRLGPFYVQTLRPNGDHTTTDWTPSSGLTNYEMVDEEFADDATTYVSSSTVNDTDYYDYESLPTGAFNGELDTIFGVRTVSIVRKMSGGDRLIRNTISSGLSTAESTADGVPVDWFASKSMSETDPDTAAAWTVSGINAAKFGITIES